MMFVPVSYTHLDVYKRQGYSFTKYSGIGKATFNGLTNYMRLFKDRLFWISLKNTMIMFILAFVLLLSLSFLIACLLYTSEADPLQMFGRFI